jgi:formate dehydrogenase iron-sulfur subunit
MRTLIDDLLHEQAALPAVERFAQWHDREHSAQGRYSALLPTATPAPGQQYAFEVNLDSCTGCKACVVACHSLNGLSESESWRSVGELVSTDPSNPMRQTVTTACHHCVDPACANGCPTLAYEKDQHTGIVQHLDDQCIGCGYCTMTCPYEVPQIEPALGIVRKCDMCRQRLDVGEAPACVQSCPNGAIKIVLVSQSEIRTETRTTTLLPTAPSSAITAPTTRFISAQPLPASLVPGQSIAPMQPAHWPLVFMLVLSQAGAGALCFAAWSGDQRTAIIGTVLGFLGSGAAMLHLGRPLQAWRAWLGWRKSWLSREIIAFGLHGPLAAGFALTLHPLLGAAAAVSGVLGVVCSGMLYHATRRVWWSGWRSVGRFIGSALLLGAALHASVPALLIAATLKLVLELRLQRSDEVCLADDSSPHEPSMHRSLRLLHTRFGIWQRSYIALLIIGAALGSFPLLLIAELIERSLFFRTVSPAQMPGWTPNRTH